MMQNKKLQGISILFITTILYAFYGIYSRMIAQSFEVFTQNWVRNLFVLGITVILLLFAKKKWKKIKRKDAPWIGLWVLCDVLFVITLFIAFNNLSIGTTLFLLYSGITIAGYLAGTFLLKEKLTKIKIAAILLSVAGLIFIYGGQIQSTNTFFLILGFLSGLIGGLWFVLPKLISEEYPRLQLVALDAAGILVVNLILALIYQQTVPPLEPSIAWLGIFLYGITQFAADLLIIRGFRLVEAHIGFGALLGFLFFHETLSGATIIGGLLILAGALLPNFQKSK
jgi:drug/metabolite transporter (DMT)-like permease